MRYKSVSNQSSIISHQSSVIVHVISPSVISHHLLPHQNEILPRGRATVRVAGKVMVRFRLGQGGYNSYQDEVCQRQ
jgi:hypothetical protein